MSTLKTNNIQHVDRSEPSIIIDTSGSVSIAGTLTYEDVTNVDSVGIITARGLNIFGNTTGLNATGVSTFTGNVSMGGGNIVFGDSGGSSDDRLIFGAGTDLSIFHDGSNSRINSATGIFNIQSDDFRVTDAANSLTAFKIDPDGATDLRYNGSVKIQTTSSGGTLTGDFTFTGNIYAGNHISILDSDGSSDMLKIGASEDIRIYHYNNNSYIRQHTDLPLIIGGTSTGQSLYLQPKDGENSAIFKPNGSVELYYDNSKKLYTDTDGVTIGGPGYERLKIDGQVGDCILASSGAEIQFTRDSQNNITCTGSSSTLRLNGNSKLMANFVSNGAAELYHNNVKKIETGGSFNYIYGIASGNPAGLAVRNTNTASNYDHASLRLESKNNAAYGTVYTDIANASLRLGYNTTGNTFNVFNDGTVRAAGIKFGSDTATENTLNDYEEGTYTPVVTSSNGGTGTLNNSVDKLNYTKVGRLVTITGRILISSFSGSNGTLRISLPFNTAYGHAGQSDYVHFMINTHGVDLDNNTVQIFAEAGANFSYVSMFQVIDNGNWSGYNTSNLKENNNEYFALVGSYQSV